MRERRLISPVRRETAGQELHWRVVRLVGQLLVTAVPALQVVELNLVRARAQLSSQLDLPERGVGSQRQLHDVMTHLEVEVYGDHACK